MKLFLSIVSVLLVFSGSLILRAASDTVRINQSKIPPHGKILFAKWYPTYGLYYADLDMQQTRRLSRMDAMSPMWSPDGNRILFTSRTDSDNEIYAMNIDGTQLTNLTNNSHNDTQATWSPDSTHIAFVSDRDGNDEIYVMSSAGDDLTRLTNNEVYDNDPTWSPDGTHIAYVWDGEIYVMNVDGSNKINLTNDAESYDFGPSWSPDSKQIVFSKGNGGLVDNQSRVYITSVFSRNSPLPLPIPIFINNSGFPIWSPNGEYIAFASTQGPSHGFYMFHIDSGTTSLLTDEIGFSAIWSPDSLFIAYVTSCGLYEDTGITIVGLDGSYTRCIAYSAGPGEMSWLANEEVLN